MPALALEGSGREAHRGAGVHWASEKLPLQCAAVLCSIAFPQIKFDMFHCSGVLHDLKTCRGGGGTVRGTSLVQTKENTAYTDCSALRTMQRNTGMEMDAPGGRGEIAARAIIGRITREGR